MDDSSCLSKQQKKRQKRTAKRLLKKITDDKVEVEKNPDPLELLKEKLAEAKTTGNHNLAMKLRQDIWVLQDTSAGHNPSLSKGEVETSLNRIAANCDQTTPDEPIFQNPTEKRLRSLNKKLKQIEVLKTRLKNGEELEASQIAKINSEEKILEEIDEINSSDFYF